MKIQKLQSEAVNQRTTDNTMTKSKRIKNDLQNTTQKIKVEQHEPHSKPGVNPGAPEE